MIARGRIDEAFEPTPGFGFDREILWDRRFSMRDALITREPIYAPYFAARLGIESQKAIAAFSNGKIEIPEGLTGRTAGRPKGSYADAALDKRCSAAWSTGQYEDYTQCARALGEGVSSADVRQSLDRIRARERRVRQKLSQRKSK
jgi:hypothetical protein